MKIVVDKDGSLRLDEPENFKDLRVVDETEHGIDLAASLAKVGTLTPEGTHAWLKPDGIRSLVPADLKTATWSAAFDGMLGFAKKFGWINETDGTVRAHVVRS
jgi:hypothetical protein